MALQLPTAFKEKYQKLLGDQASDFFAALQGSSQSGFRINPLKDGLPQASLDQAHGNVPGVATGYYGQVDGHSLDHVTGWVYSQEPSAMNVGEVVDPQPGERVLDLCAAPGGKSTHLIAKMGDQGLLVANEIFRKRAKVLASNMERWGTANTVVTNEDPDSLSQRYPQYFDRILVDAPCSGEGMFRKDPAAIEYWHPEYPAECANRQRKILASALKMLRPGGTLVYSTCTFAPEEDEQNVAWLLDNYSDLRIIPLEPENGMDHGRPEWADGNPDLKGTLRLFPHHYHGEGHFIAKLSKAGQAQSQPKSHHKNKKRAQKRGLERNEKQIFEEWCQEVGWQANHLKLQKMGHELWALPQLLDNVDNLKVISAGLHLGTFKKKRFEPAYALALHLQPSAVRHLDISLDQWQKYVHGDVISTDQTGKGWYLLVCQGHSCGWGRLVSGQIKNFFPNGLRFSI